MQAIWLLLMENNFMHAYEFGIVIESLDDTPEIVNHTLDGEISNTKDYKADLEDNQEKDNDLDSLPGAPDPDTIVWPTEEIPSPPLNATPQRPTHKTPLPASLPVTPTPMKPSTPKSPILSALFQNPQPITQATTQPLQSHKMSNSPTPGWFHGKPDENAQNFLKEVDHYIVLNKLKTEAMKVVIFSTLLSAGSIADSWWTKLDSAKKTMWASVQTEFNSRWPAITIAEKTGLDY
ncbi:hypothetical protein DFH29DRAFT_1005083 [Suillus ampliporus]|nr:hypothetical protein DFH29DRAFT_1005083 [Suillus ampliporus]